MKIQNMTSSNGNAVANKFIIFDGDAIYFQSYDLIIVKTCFDDYVRKVYLDKTYWNYNKTTSKYRNQFLGETTKEIQTKIDSGEYLLTDLNK